MNLSLVFFLQQSIGLISAVELELELELAPAYFFSPTLATA